MKLHEDLKRIIYWVTLGMGLVIYAHASFSTKEDVKRVESQVTSLADKKDVFRIESKLDRLIFKLIGEK